MISDTTNYHIISYYIISYPHPLSPTKPTTSNLQTYQPYYASTSTPSNTTYTSITN